MINLLLPEDKKIISKEYHSRVMVSYAIAVGLLLLIALIAVVSFYGSLFINQNSLKKQLDAEGGGSGVNGLDDYSLQISQANKMIVVLTGDRGNLHLASDLVDRVISVKPSGIKIKTLEIGKGEKEAWSLILRGTSHQRNDLIEFISALKKDPLFTKIDSPIANLIKGANSEFSVVIVLSELQKNDQ